MGRCCSGNSTMLPGLPGPIGPMGPPGNFVITDILWVDLALLQSTNAMIEGYYRITDYATTGNIPNAADAVLGPIEPLIVFALNSSSLYHQVWSETYPQDILFYELNDTTTQGAVLGRIYYREDTIKNLIAPYDWREWLFRRWETTIGSGIYTLFTDPLGGEAFQDFRTFGNSNTGGTCSAIDIKEITESDVALNSAPSDYLNNIIIDIDSYDITFGRSNWNMNLSATAQHNLFKDGINSIDFTGATHVYFNYDCIIFTNAAPTYALSYYDAANSLTVVLPTA